MDEKRTNLDLNTLRVFVAVHDTRSVSAAAQGLNLSQSGVSTALARLRIQFEDALFTKTASGMEPTARARELVGPARKIIHDIESHLLAPQEFDPHTSEREFVLALSDIGEGIYLPNMIRSLYQQHSGITLRSLYLPARQREEAMANGEVDMAVGYFPDITSNQFHMHRIGLHSFTCIARTAHPIARGRLTQQQFAELGHVVVEPPGRSLEVKAGEVREADHERERMVAFLHGRMGAGARGPCRRRLLQRGHALDELPAALAADADLGFPLAGAARNGSGRRLAHSDHEPL